MENDKVTAYRWRTLMRALGLPDDTSAEDLAEEINTLRRRDFIGRAKLEDMECTDLVDYLRPATLLWIDINAYRWAIEEYQRDAEELEPCGPNSPPAANASGRWRSPTATTPPDDTEASE